jgi:cytochrome d ubiquinol oxidase subunit I
VGASLLAFIVVYFFVFGAGTFYLMRLMSKPPESHDDPRLQGPLRAPRAFTPAAQTSARGE